MTDTRTWHTGCGHCGSTWDTRTWPRWYWPRCLRPPSTRTRPPSLSQIWLKSAKLESELEHCCVTRSVTRQRLKTLQLSYRVCDKKSAMVQSTWTWPGLHWSDWIVNFLLGTTKQASKMSFMKIATITTTNIMTSSSFLWE